MRVIVCGSRDWTDEVTIGYAIRGLPVTAVIVHGACRGADEIAGRVACHFGLAVELHPYKSELGKAGGPARNADMVEAGADLCLSFHDDINASKGTRDMTSKAIAARIPVIFIRSQPKEGEPHGG